jgi:DNA-binding NarL/FixJ family response regulator
MMKLLIVDDSELIRSRLVALSQCVCGLAEICTAGTLEQTLYCMKHPHPTLVILDFQLPDGPATQILPILKQVDPGMRIAVLTNHSNDFIRNKCLQAGADWFFDKSTEFEKVLELVHQQAVLH